MPMRLLPPITIILLVTLAVLTAAAAADSSRLMHNPEMSQLLAAGKPPDGLRWYSTGRENFPDAVIGLKSGWRQGAKFWREVDPHTDNAGMVIQNVMHYRDRDPQALDIVAPDGEVIGVYWSSIYWTIIRVGGEQEIRVYRPTPPPRP